MDFTNDIASVLQFCIGTTKLSGRVSRLAIQYLLPEREIFFKNNNISIP